MIREMDRFDVAYLVAVTGLYVHGLDGNNVLMQQGFQKRQV